MNPNSTYNLVYEKTPYNGMVTSTTYSSTNESVVKVSEDGELTAVNIGTSTIRVTVNTGLSASINVYVIDKQVTPNIYVIPTSLAFTDESYEIEVGDNKKLSYTAVPNSATSNYIEFTSNNSNVATVDNSGFVKGISAGDAVITISCEVAPTLLYPVTSIAFSVIVFPNVCPSTTFGVAILILVPCSL